MRHVVAAATFTIPKVCILAPNNIHIINGLNGRIVKFRLPVHVVGCQKRWRRPRTPKKVV